jgi:hypothetical protein
MYIFTRSARLGAGDPREQAAWAAAITEKVNQISEVQFRLWTHVVSPGFGTLTWGGSVESLSQLEAIEDKLMADDGYLGLVAEGAKHSAGEAIDDQLLQVIHAEPVDMESIHYLSVTTASAAPGQLARAVEVGVELAQKAKEVTGLPSTFAASVNGPYGSFAWIGGAGSIEELERSSQGLADPTFVALVDEKASQCFVASSAVQIMARRLI